MSVESEHTMRDYLDALLHGGDFASHFSDDVVWTTMETGEQVRGREAVRDFIVSLHSTLFRASPELRGMAVTDDGAALEAVFVGTHIGEFAGIAPTGAEVRLPYAVFYDLAGGRITALRAYFPILALVQQLQTAAAARA
jgi:predicted ester cyclase